MPKRAGKKFLSIILCAALMLSCLSFALAEEAVPAVSGALSPLFRRILGLQEVSQ